MSPFIKALLDHLVKPTADSLIAELKANEAANIAAIEAQVGNGTNALDAVVTKLTAGLKVNTFFAAAVEIFAPQLLNGIHAAIDVGEATVPELYAEGLAFLEKEDSYL